MRVVITGLGVVAPNGIGVTEFESALRAGKSGIRYLEVLKTLKLGCHVGGKPAISMEQKQQYLPDLMLKKLEADGVLYGCMAGVEAWRDAGLIQPTKENPKTDWDSGCIVGAGLPGTDAIRTSIYAVDAGKAKRLGSTTVPQTMSSGVSAFLGGLLGLGNQVTTNGSACSTGSEAIIMGYERIKNGKAKRMLCGGCDSASPYVWAGFDAMRVLNRRSNEAPEKASRPMSATAAGFIPGGGAGVLVLESLESATARGAKIYAEIIGGYINSGGQQNGGTMTAPNAEGVQRCIKGALADAEIQASEVDAICGHLTATHFDAKEIENWTIALNRKGKDFPYISSLKSMIGHCLSAAGAIESVATILELYHGFLHPSINCEDIHPKIEELIDTTKIPTTTLNIDLNTIIKSSFGFGDVNSCVIFKKFKQD